MSNVDFKDQLTALQRTVTSFLVGFLITQAARLGLDINDPAAVAALTVAIGGVWYAVFHYLEVAGHSAWGWFLGKVGSPRYAKDVAVVKEEFKVVEPILKPALVPVVTQTEAQLAEALARAEDAIKKVTPPAPPTAT